MSIPRHLFHAKNRGDCSTITQMQVSDLVRTLLTKRGIPESEFETFLSPNYEQHTHSPFLFKDMDVAVARVFAAMERGERITVYADFDCDGIPGASVLSDLFRKIGYENVTVYLPHRDKEGYGFHIAAIEKLATEGTKLIITVDVGTTAIEPVKFAKGLGVDVIVTDHHEIPGELPDAVAVLNPKIAPYPFPGLCGAGVAFKLAQALLYKGRSCVDKGPTFAGFATIPEGWEKWLLDLVAIATVADLVPLVGENRTLVYWGLQVLRKSPRPGIVALVNQLRLRKAELDETDIGFSFAPRINAASRMGEPGLALRLLTTQDRAEAAKIASELETLNASRKGVVAGIVKEAKKRARQRFNEGDAITVLGDTEWKPALLGLAANSVMNERGGVVCLWGRDANGVLKGSCRSDGNISIMDLFSNARASLVESGGHAASGGFTVTSENIHTLPEVLAQAAAACNAIGSPEAPSHDSLTSLREISASLFREVSLLAPFGMGNSKPIFRIPRARIISVRRFGKEKNHTEVSLLCSETGKTQRAFQFFKAPENFSRLPIPDDLVDVLATIERDSFRGGHALRIVDILSI